MSLILNIDTALNLASVCLANDGNPLQVIKNENQKDHAAWLHPAIKEIFDGNKYKMKHLQAVAVTIGPGSYTGLRVGLASAKGLCYTMNIPLIAIGTLDIMALSVEQEANDFICPLIDARRMEVFTAIYNKSLKQIAGPQAMIIDENSFDQFLAQHQIVFCGSGSKKLKEKILSSNALFSNTVSDASHLGKLSYKSFSRKEFTALAYAEPVYLKEFYSPDRK